MDIHTAVEYICSVDAELKVIPLLLKSHERKFEKTFNDLCIKEASLRAIYKLNKEYYKDEAIDALSNVNNYEDKKDNFIWR